jgi:hypothetical protein
MLRRRSTVTVFQDPIQALPLMAVQCSAIQGHKMSELGLHRDGYRQQAAHRIEFFGEAKRGLGRVAAQT